MNKEKFKEISVQINAAQDDNMEIEFPITNDIVFNLAMQDPNLCRQMLERIFPDKEIGEVRLVGQDEDNSSNKSSNSILLNTQQVLETGIAAKGVRLDVFMASENEWYDIEMQCQDFKDLPKRSRYYHSTMDITMLKRGQLYSNLNPSYVIFICTEDLFKENLPIYHFQNLCEEKVDEKLCLKLNDGTCTIFLNAACTDKSIPKSLKTLFDYICKMKCTGEDLFITALHNKVKELNSAEGRKILRTLEDKINDEKRRGYKAGLAEGELKGKKQDALAMLKKGLDIQLISEITGLSTEEIKRL